MTSSDTPILLLVFNRPDKVRQLLSALAKVQPKKLYVSADGPRVGVVADVQKCQETRALFLEIPWECEVVTNFSDTNLGCMNGPVSGINWFFDQVEEGIILEDDCIPSPAFFPYITELLNIYRENGQIMHLSGTSFLKKESTNLNSDYYFSKIAHGWGWATWRRAWNKFDLEMKHIKELEDDMKKQKPFLFTKHQKFWLRLFKHISRSKTDMGIWDAQWEYSILYNNGICVTPTTNFIENVGFDAEATHTKKKPSFINQTESQTRLSQKTKDIAINYDFDAQIMREVFQTSLPNKISSTLKEWYYDLFKSNC